MLDDVLGKGGKAMGSVAEVGWVPTPRCSVGYRGGDGAGSVLPSASASACCAACCMMACRWGGGEYGG